MPSNLQRYEISDKGTRIKNKYLQHVMRGIFVRLLDDSAGMHDLIYQGTIKIRNIELGNRNIEPLREKIGGTIGIKTPFPDNSGLSQLEVDALIDNPGEQDNIALTTTEGK